MSETETVPTLGDGDDGDGELEIIPAEEEALDLYRPTDPDEIRRAFIIEKVLDSDSVALKGLVESMEAIHAWLATGEVRQAPPPRKEPALKVVK